MVSEKLDELHLGNELTHNHEVWKLQGHAAQSLNNVTLINELKKNYGDIVRLCRVEI